MDLKRINQKLTELFADYRIVFWDDPNADFEISHLSCLPQGVEVLRPDLIGQFKTKFIIEVEKPKTNFLVYTPKSEPRPEEDWLLDIRLYSYQFHADTASMYLEELGLKNYRLRDHLQKRIEFFENPQRLPKLKAFIQLNDDENEIDRKMLAVLVNAKNDQLFDILQAIFVNFPIDQGLDGLPEVFKTIEKAKFSEVFWLLVKEELGYGSQVPTLRQLLSFLFVSDLSLTMGNRLFPNVKQFVLPSVFVRNVAVGLSGWRDSSNEKITLSYDRLSDLVSKDLGLEKNFNELNLESTEEIETFKRVITFPSSEYCAIRIIKGYILSHKDTIDKDFVMDFCRQRQDMHWSNKQLSEESIPRSGFWSVYEALKAVTEFLAKKRDYKNQLNYSNSKELFEAYAADLYLFDRYYRTFNEHANIVDTHWDILKDVKGQIEDLYSNWFLGTITHLWETKIDLSAWHVDGVFNQYDFYEKYPAAKARESNAKVYVIISDALRYEAAVEITEILQGKYRVTAKREAMLGVVPSYTTLGMASLLPHDKLTYKNNGDVLADNQTTSSTVNRNDVLAKFKGLALQSNEFIQQSRDEARALVKDKNIVYLYHNTIDAIGDDAKTEAKTFSGVREAINEICKIVTYLVNQLNARYVFITADHGFVFQEQHPDEADRNMVELPEKDLIKKKKRYVIGKNIPKLDFVNQGLVSNTAGVSLEGDAQFVVPKGMSLFHFVGGSRFFHGGMSLQEITVPVITVEQAIGKEKEKTRDKEVGIQVLGQDFRITTGKHRFELLQLDAVSDRTKAVTLKLGIFSETELVSDVQTITFDSVSPEMADRKKEILLTLKNIMFSNANSYRLVLRYALTDVEAQSIPVRIDRAFISDF